MIILVDIKESGPGIHSSEKSEKGKVRTLTFAYMLSFKLLHTVIFSPPIDPSSARVQRLHKSATTGRSC